MSAVREAIASLHPAYFAMVMATGIVSIAARLSGMPLVAAALFRLNIGLYVILGLLLLARLVLETGRVLADLQDHNRGVGLLTIVAGTCVLGNQFVLVGNNVWAASLLWVLGVILWLILVYAIYTGLTIKPRKPSLEEGLNGAWLLPVVATQSVSTLGSLLAPSYPAYREAVLFFSLTMWLGGGMLYLWIISLIFYRYMFFILDPAYLTPPYWINMGAMAISTLAGTGLIAHAGAGGLPLLGDLLPFLKGFTLLFWTTATMWIPMLVILGAWRHLVRRFPLRYDPAYWGAVFPLGMYTVCTYRLADSLSLPFLRTVPRYAVYVALTAWLATALGLALHLGKFAVASARRAR